MIRDLEVKMLILLRLVPEKELREIRYLQHLYNSIEIALRISFNFPGLKFPPFFL